MKADEDPTGTLLAGLRRATESVEPPPDFAARVLAATSRARPRSVWWAQLGPAARRIVPFAAVAAAAAMALAWSADARLDDAAA